MEELHLSPKSSMSKAAPVWNWSLHLRASWTTRIVLEDWEIHCVTLSDLAHSIALSAGAARIAIANPWPTLHRTDPEMALLQIVEADSSRP